MQFIQTIFSYIANFFSGLFAWFKSGFQGGLSGLFERVSNGGQQRMDDPETEGPEPVNQQQNPNLTSAVTQGPQRRIDTARLQTTVSGLARTFLTGRQIQEPSLSPLVTNFTTIATGVINANPGLVTNANGNYTRLAGAVARALLRDNTMGAEIRRIAGTGRLITPTDNMILNGAFGETGLIETITQQLTNNNFTQAVTAPIIVANAGAGNPNHNLPRPEEMARGR